MFTVVSIVVLMENGRFELEPRTVGERCANTTVRVHVGGHLLVRVLWGMQHTGQGQAQHSVSPAAWMLPDLMLAL